MCLLLISNQISDYFLIIDTFKAKLCRFSSLLCFIVHKRSETYRQRAVKEMVEN